MDPKKLPPTFAGRRFDQQLLQDLPPGADPCGENGEFHTFVFSAPQVFDRAIDIHLCSDPRLRVERGGFVFFDVVPRDMELDSAAAEAYKARREAAAADAAAAAAAVGGQDGEDGCCPIAAHRAAKQAGEDVC